MCLSSKSGGTKEIMENKWENAKQCMNDGGVLHAIATHKSISKEFLKSYLRKEKVTFNS
jgi:hypothetical protein